MKISKLQASVLDAAYFSFHTLQDEE